MLLNVTSKGFRDLFSFFKTTWGSKPQSNRIDLTSFQKSFNIEFRKYLNAKALKFKMITDESLVQKTIDHYLELVNGGGKRIRPYVCSLAYQTEGGIDHEAIMKMGIGLETFHAFALIHDDIIDAGKERHGMPTIHQFVESILADCDKGDKRRVSEGMALLAGDLAFSWASELVVQAGNAEVYRLYFSMIEETVAGQALDVSLMTKQRVESAVLLKKNELKTARYSFVNPMLIGAALAGSHVHDELYEKLGMCLGQAFQIQDDLLDVSSDSSATGKTSMLDIQDGQHTCITQYVFEHGTEHEQDILSSLFCKPVDDSSRRVLSSLFESSGSIRHAETEISLLFSEARRLVEKSDMKPDVKKLWFALMQLLDKRKS